MKNLFLLSLLFLISSCSTDEVDTSTDLKSNTLTKSINIETSTNSTYKAPSPLTYYVTCTSTSTPPNTYTANIYWNAPLISATGLSYLQIEPLDSNLNSYPIVNIPIPNTSNGNINIIHDYTGNYNDVWLATNGDIHINAKWFNVSHLHIDANNQISSPWVFYDLIQFP